MQAVLIGIDETGCLTRDPTLPASAAYSLQTSVGEDSAITLLAYADTGVPLDLTGAVVTLTAKRSSQSPIVAWSATGAAAPDLGKCAVRFTIPPSATQRLDPGRHVYSVTAVFPGPPALRKVLVPISAWTLQAAVFNG